MKATVRAMVKTTHISNAVSALMKLIVDCILEFGNQFSLNFFKSIFTLLV
jgi:hypothetical protein